MADNNKFYIDTRLGTENLPKDASKVKSMLNSLAGTAKETGRKMGKAISNGMKEARTRGSGVDTDEYKAMEKAIDKVKAKIDGLIEKEIKLQEMGGNTGGRQMASYEYDLERAQQELQRLEMEKARADKMLSRPFGSRAITMLKSGVSGLVGAFKKATVVAGRFIKTLGSAVIDRFKNKLSGLKSGLGGVGGGFDHGFKTMLKYGLGIRSLFVLFNRLRNALIDGMNNLAQFNNGQNKTAQSINMLKGSLLTLKNSFASAFAPILTAIAPALTTLINMISKAVTYVGMLIGALTGQKTFVQATQQQNAYSASMDKSAKSAKKLAKAQKQLYSFDTLNKTDNKPDKDTGADGGGGAGGGAGNMFKEVEIPDSFSKLADKIKEVLASNDWSSIGEFVATKINGVLAKIPWNKINSGALHLASGIGTLINGFVNKLNWNLLGQTIAKGINTAVLFANKLLTTIDFNKIGTSIAKALNSVIRTIDWVNLGALFGNRFNAVLHALQGFVTKFDWANLGTSLATGLNSLFNTIDWKAIGDTFSKSFIGILTTLSAFLKKTNWSGLAHDIADMLGAVDWSGCAKALFDALGAALGAGVSLIGTWVKGVVDGIKGYFTKYIKDENGDGHFGAGEIITGICEGIVNALKNIGTWIKENIFDPFIKGFKAAFKIHSPSKVMEEQGGFIIKGLFDGIIDALKTIGEWIKTNIFSPFIKGFETAFGIAGGVASTIKDKGLAIVNGLKEGISGMWDAVKEIVGTLVSNFGDKFDSIKKDAVEAFEKLKEGVTDILTALGGAIKKPINAIMSGIESMCNGVIKGVNRMIDALNGLKFSIPDWVPGLGGKSFGLNIGKLKEVSLPRLATGAVVPRTSKEFAAILGDNNKETEIVSPLSTMKQALSEALAESGIGGSQQITIKFEGTGAELVRMLKPMIDKENKRVGTQLIVGGVN